MITKLRVLVAAVVLLALPCLAQEPWPSRPLRLVAPFTPAGATDILARLTAEGLSARLKQSVVVENRPGGGSVLGGEVVARASPDGYTLLMAPSTVYAAGMSLYAKPKLDPSRDFAPVATVAFVPHVLVVDAALPIRDVRGLIATAKADPGKLLMASQGMGTISHLEGELFQFQAGIQMTHVPYKGSAPAHVDLIGGRVQVMFDSVAAALPHIRSGRLRALGVTNASRTAALPEVPPVGEAGLTGFVADSWLGVFAPARTPAAVLERLRSEIAALAADAAFVKRVTEAGFEPRVLGADEYAALMRRETQRWALVVQRAGIRME